MVSRMLGTRYLSTGFIGFTTRRFYATLNIGNMNAGGEQGSLAPVRNEIIGSFLSAQSPHLMFFQEFTQLGPKTRKWLPYGLKPSYRYFGDSQASILYDSDVLELQPFSVKSMDVLDAGDDVVTSRLAACVLEDRVDKIKFIAASWHGRYKAKEDIKIENLQEVVQIIKGIQESEGIDHFILSGDFNLPVEKAAKVIPGHFKIHQYEGIIRKDKDVIDFIVTSKKFPLEELTAFDSETVKMKKAGMDHDISTGVANLTLEN